jgi:N-acetylneuraminic acid mutarotase
VSGGFVAGGAAILAVVFIASQLPGWHHPSGNSAVIRTAPPTATASVVGADSVTGAPGRWVARPDSPGATGAFVTWTGSEVLAGPQGTKGNLNPWRVYAYDAASHQWQSHAGPRGLKPRTPFATVWDGSELLFLGGFIASPPTRASAFTTTTDSWAFNPKTLLWHRIAPLPVSPEQTMSAFWTGQQVLLFSGDTHTFSYDPLANTWTTRPGMPGGLRSGASLAWTGTQLLVWGGVQGQTSVADGWRYDPHAGVWTRMAPAPAGAFDAASAWTGDQFLVWGGKTTTDDEQTSALHTGGYSYDPDTNAWATLPAAPYATLVGATATWTGDAFLVWGRGVLTGQAKGPARGAAYDPISASWHVLDTASDVAGPGAKAFWTGDSMLVVGGWRTKEPAVGTSPHVSEWFPEY